MPEAVSLSSFRDRLDRCGVDARFTSTMKTTLLTALREARTALGAAAPAEPGEAAVAKKLARDLDETIARLEGKEPPKDLMSIVCHDIKDPLASIVMGAGFLKKTIPADDAPARRVVDAIARSADRMNRVVSDFHDLAKLESGTLEIEVRSCDVAAVLDAATSLLGQQARGADVALRFEAASSPLPAVCDRARLLQIVSKLVDNAVRFTASGGQVLVRAEREGAFVRVSVRDTGRGIPAERLDEIFDRAANARRSPRDGPGLGLAIARGLVEAQGGSVGVESRPDEGSLFWFTLPVSER
jgi:signal transduction histidine kinase